MSTKPIDMVMDASQKLSGAKIVKHANGPTSYSPFSTPQPDEYAPRSVLDTEVWKPIQKPTAHKIMEDMKSKATNHEEYLKEQRAGGKMPKALERERQKAEKDARRKAALPAKFQSKAVDNAAVAAPAPSEVTHAIARARTARASTTKRNATVDQASMAPMISSPTTIDSPSPQVTKSYANGDATVQENTKYRAGAAKLPAANEDEFDEDKSDYASETDMAELDFLIKKDHDQIKASNDGTRTTPPEGYDDDDDFDYEAALQAAMDKGDEEDANAEKAKESERSITEHMTSIGEKTNTSLNAPIEKHEDLFEELFGERSSEQKDSSFAKVDGPGVTDTLTLGDTNESVEGAITSTEVVDSPTTKSPRAKSNAAVSSSLSATTNLDEDDQVAIETEPEVTEYEGVKTVWDVLKVIMTRGSEGPKAIVRNYGDGKAEIVLTNIRVDFDELADLSWSPPEAEEGDVDQKKDIIASKSYSKRKRSDDDDGENDEKPVARKPKTNGALLTTSKPTPQRRIARPASKNTKSPAAASKAEGKATAVPVQDVSPANEAHEASVKASTKAVPSSRIRKRSRIIVEEDEEDENGAVEEPATKKQKTTTIVKLVGKAPDLSGVGPFLNKRDTAMSGLEKKKSGPASAPMTRHKQVGKAAPTTANSGSRRATAPKKEVPARSTAPVKRGSAKADATKKGNKVTKPAAKAITTTKMPNPQSRFKLTPSRRSERMRSSNVR